MTTSRRLEPSPEEFRRLVDQAVDRLVGHLTTLPEQPAADLKEATEAARQVARGIPEEGRDYQELLDLLFDRAVPASFNCASPGYLAYIPGGGLVHAAVADLIADVTNRYTGVWRAAPALVQLELDVIRWMSDLVGLPTEARGILTTGGSMANFSGIVAARCDRLPTNFLSGTLYVSDQVHHSVTKAALLAGFAPRNIRSIPSDRHFRLRLDLLAEAIANDRDRGRTPFLVVASAGTTNTGAVDDLPAVAEVAAREGLWLHVDAAYGGFFLLTERGRQRLAGIERADSVVLDPHKGLFLPYGTGALLVRDGSILRSSHGGDAEYLPPLADDDPSAMDFCAYSPELSRDFRGLRLWLPLQLAGVGTFRSYLEEKLYLARLAADELRVLPDVEVVAEPDLSLLAFRWAPRGVSKVRLDTLNRRLLEAVNARQRVHLTGTIAHGRFVLRICILSFRTHEEHLMACLEDLRAAMAELGG